MCHFDVLAKACAKVVVITAKDKLRKQLGKDLDVSKGHVCFSSQHADKCTMEENGIQGRTAHRQNPREDSYGAA